MKFREWLAWKLRRAAWVIYDGSFTEYVNILSPDGKTALSMTVVGDEYEFGIDSWTEKFPDDWLVEVWS